MLWRVLKEGVRLPLAAEMSITEYLSILLL